MAKMDDAELWVENDKLDRSRIENALLALSETIVGQVETAARSKRDRDIGCRVTELLQFSTVETTARSIRIETPRCRGAEADEYARSSKDRDIA